MQRDTFAAGVGIAERGGTAASLVAGAASRERAEALLASGASFLQPNGGVGSNRRGGRMGGARDRRPRDARSSAKAALCKAIDRVVMVAVRQGGADDNDGFE